VTSRVKKNYILSYRVKIIKILKMDDFDLDNTITTEYMKNMIKNEAEKQTLNLRKELNFYRLIIFLMAVIGTLIYYKQMERIDILQNTIISERNVLEDKMITINWMIEDFIRALRAAKFDINYRL